MSIRQSEYIVEMIKKKVTRNIEIVNINSKMKKSEKQLLFRKTNETWNKYDCLIYTPSLITGVSFDIEDHFDSIYMYLCYESVGCLEILQMLHRVRKPKDKKIYLTNDNTDVFFSSKKNYI